MTRVNDAKIYPLYAMQNPLINHHFFLIPPIFHRTTFGGGKKIYSQLRYLAARLWSSVILIHSRKRQIGHIFQWRNETEW